MRKPRNERIELKQHSTRNPCRDIPGLE
jgi:hypothetical protein